MYDVGPLGVRIIQEFEGAPRMQARRCEGDAWELGWGSTYYPDNSPVKEGDTLQTVEQAEEMLDHCMEMEAQPVWDALEFEPDQHQIDALASLAYNIGGSAAAESSVVRLSNEHRWVDAAAAFGMWTGASTQFESNGERVLSPDGEPSSYFRRLRGLLRRHHAEGCLFLGLEWEPACANDAVFMRTDRRWNAKKNQWQDYIISQTEFKDILPIARQYPLAPSTGIPPAQPAEDEAGPVVSRNETTAPAPQPVASEPVTEEAAPVVETVEEPVKAPVTAKTPTYTMTNDFDPEAGFKALWRSKRFWGWFLIVAGRVSFFTDGAAEATQGVPFIGPLARYIVNDPIMFDMWTGMMVMVAGEAVRWWGEKTATKALV